MRALARTVRNAIRKSHRRMLLRSSLARLDECMRAARTPDTRLMERLVRGWGNEAWSAGSPLLSAVLEWLPKSSGTIAECGSGISTLVLATAANATGREVFSFEHDPEWAAKLRGTIPDRLRSSVELCVTPIRSYGEFDWYSLDGVTPPTDIGFVLCDGPPGKTRGGRYGLGPVLKPYLARGCIVLLDDTQRSSEHEVVLRWCEELNAAVIHEGGTYNVLEVRRSAQPASRFAESRTHG
jgi:hypothetical protein